MMYPLQVRIEYEAHYWKNVSVTESEISEPSVQTDAGSDRRRETGSYGNGSLSINPVNQSVRFDTAGRGGQA
jgi:hypothetical protein